MKKIVIFLTFVSAISFGQDKVKIDLIQSIIQKTTILDNVKINSYKSLLYDYMYLDKDSASLI